MSTHAPEDLYALGGTRLAAGDYSGAVTAYQAAAALCPQSASILNNLGVALTGMGRLHEAHGALEQALSVQPDYVRALVNLGKVLGVQGRPREAQTFLRRALALSPGYVPALVNLGDMQGASGDYADAAQTLRHAVELSPRSADARRSLGMALVRVGQMYDATDTLLQAVALQPASAENHTALAQVLMLEGRWREAWPHFEHRLRRTRQAQSSTLPSGARWDGGELGGRTLWLIGEQGLGDQIQFARYARVLRERGVRCVLSSDARLVRLFRLADLANDTVAGDATFDAQACRWLPLLSAPAWHETVPGNVPLRSGYLQAEPARVEAWRARLGAHDGATVAFAWQGNPATETGWFAGRSPPLASLAPLWSVQGVRYVALQKGPAAQALREPGLRRRLQPLESFDEGPNAFLDSAAILACVDLLITSDSALAHLAGALGVECWLCLHAHPDWRWLRHSADCAWYASVRLFRQARPGDWEALFQQVAAALRARTQAQSARASHAAAGHP